MRGAPKRGPTIVTGAPQFGLLSPTALFYLSELPHSCLVFLMMGEPRNDRPGHHRGTILSRKRVIDVRQGCVPDSRSPSAALIPIA